MCPLHRIGKIAFEKLHAGDRMVFHYNPNSLMVEMWGRYSADRDDSWFLIDAFPGFLSFIEGFRSGLVWAVDLVGDPALVFENAWNVNGNRAGGAPNPGSFSPASGELVMRTTAVPTDWIAIHTGGNYAWRIRTDRPRATFSIHEISDPTNLHFLMGLVGLNGLETASGFPWTTPDEGVWVEYDSAIDNQVHFVTRNAGVPTDTPIGVLDSENWLALFRVNDAADQIDCSSLVLQASHTTNLPLVTNLKPIFLVENRTNRVRSLNPSWCIITMVGET